MFGIYVYVRLATIIIGASFAAQVENSESSTLPDHEAQITLSTCKSEVAKSVAALQTVGINYSVKVDYRVPHLSRMTGESAFFYYDRGKMFFKFERTFPPLPDRPQVIESEEMSFDGQVFYIGKNTEGAAPSIKTILGENPDSPHAWQQSSRTCLYLEAAGFRIPTKVAQWRNPFLGSIALEYLKIGEAVSTTMEKSLLRISATIPEPAVLFAQKMNLELLSNEMKQNGQPPAEIQARIGEVQRLRASDRKRRVTLWLDPAKGFALVRRVEETTVGQLICRVQVDQLEYTDNAGLWLPKVATIETFVRDVELVQGFTDIPNRTDSVALQDVSFDAKDDIGFSLDYGPGTMVADRSSLASKSAPSGKVVYVTPGSLSDLRTVAESQRRRNWLIIVNGLLLTLLLGLLVRKYVFHKE